MWRARVRQLVGAFRRVPVAVFALAFAVLAINYCANDDMAGDPAAPRGDGKYRPVLARGDGHIYYSMLLSIALDGDLVLDDELRAFGDPWNQMMSPTGRKYVAHPIGPALVWMPAFAVAHGTAKLANLFGADIPTHGYTAWHQRIVLFTSVCFAWLAALWGYLVARKWIGGRWGPLYAAIAVLFGTSVTYYAMFMPSYPHAMDAAACGGFLALWALGYGDLRWRRFVVLGVPLGIAALIRTQELVMGIALAVEVVALAARPPAEVRADRWRWARHAGGLVARGAVTLGVALVLFIPQLFAWKAISGEYFHQAYGPGLVRYDHPQILELLFAGQNGWFSTTPIAYLAVLGLAFVPRRARVIGLGLGLALAAQVYLNASIMDWWASASFGQRRLCSVTTVLVVGLAALLRAVSLGAARLRLRLWMRHAIAGVVLAWFVVWNWSGVWGLRHGKAAGRVAGGHPFYSLPEFQRAIARPIHDRIGNPFAFPANVLFAWRHDVPVRRWDEITGIYAFNPPLDQYWRGTHRLRKATWPLATAPRFRVSGFGALGKDGARAYVPVAAERAVALVPLLLPEAHRFTLPIAAVGDAAPEVVIRWNGTERARRSVGAAWLDVTFDVPAADIAVGINTLVVEAPAGTARVGNLGLGFPPP